MSGLSRALTAEAQRFVLRYQLLPGAAKLSAVIVSVRLVGSSRKRG